MHCSLPSLKENVNTKWYTGGFPSPLDSSPTCRLKVISFMRVFVQEEVISSRIPRDPLGQVFDLGGRSVGQLNGLVREVDFLWHITDASHIQGQDIFITA